MPFLLFALLHAVTFYRVYADLFDEEVEDVEFMEFQNNMQKAIQASLDEDESSLAIRY